MFIGNDCVNSVGDLCVVSSRSLSFFDIVVLVYHSFVIKTNYFFHVKLTADDGRVTVYAGGCCRMITVVQCIFALQGVTFINFIYSYIKSYLSFFFVE